jgi:uncharacterized protein YndB with AHSA1/START domain
MSEFKIVQDYLHPPQKVWRVLTDPTIIPLWTSTGKGARPVGFSTTVGTRFKFVAKPMPGWSGVVECEMLEASEPSLLRFTWRGDEKDDVTTVTCRLQPRQGGTRLTWEHTGFRGIGGFIACKMLASVRRKMLAEGFPPILAELDDNGNLHPRSALKPGPMGQTK